MRRRACCIFYNAQVRYFAISLELLKKDLCNLELKEKDFFGTYFERALDLVKIFLVVTKKEIDSNKERGHHTFVT